jgi:hypothetical protein
MSWPAVSAWGIWFENTHKLFDPVRRHFGFAIGGICFIELNRKYQDLYSIIQRRNALILRLECTETKLIKRANSTIGVSQLTEKDNLSTRPDSRSKKSKDYIIIVLTSDTDSSEKFIP